MKTGISRDEAAYAGARLDGSFPYADFLGVSIIGPQVSTQSVVFLEVQERSEDHACYAVRR
jgi:hypothetical protein